MKKEYVKPQNRLVELKDKLMGDGGGIIVPGSDPDPGHESDAKVHFEEDSDGSDSSSDVWED